MKRMWFVLALAMIVCIGMAYGENPHYKKAVRCADMGTQVTCTGSLAGLGNGDVMVTVGFTAADGSTGTTECVNAGGNRAPGQNPALPVTASGSVLITKVKNGNVSFSVTTNEPPAPTWEQAGCANRNWTAEITDVIFHGGTLSVYQDDGTGNFVLAASLTISPLFP